MRQVKYLSLLLLLVATFNVSFAQPLEYKPYPIAPGYSEEDRIALEKLNEEQNVRMIADLIKDKSIKESEIVSFSLSNKGLVVNGKRQSEETFKRFKAKYASQARVDDEWEWSWHSEKSTNSLP